jgi:PKD repeat protein
MKSILIPILAVIGLYAGKVHTQPQYSFSNYAKVDSAYNTSIASGADIGLNNFLQTGENYEWDFDNMEIATQTEYIFKSRDNSGYKTNFLLTCVLNTGNYMGCLNTWNNLSNLAKSQNEGVFLVEAEIENYTEFQRSSSQKIEATMIGVTLKIDGSSIQIPIQYTSPDVLMKLPLEFSSKDSSFSGFSSNFGSLGYNLIIKRWQKRVNHVDGWGSLQTPYAYFPQTIRMLSRAERIDTIIYESDTTAIPSIEIQVQWWSPTHGQPVFTAVGTETEEGVVFTSVSFIDSLRCLEPLLAFIQYPIQPTIDATQGFVDVTFANFTQNATNFIWDFGDTPSGSNNTSTLKNPTHRYTSGGIYQVQLIASNQSNACSTPPLGELILPLLVADTANVSASFTFNPTNPAPNEQVQFTSETQNAYSFLWEFGNGDTSTEKNPQHSYSEAGEYNVTLTASNTTKSATYSSNIVVLPTSLVSQTLTRKLTISPNPTRGKTIIGLPQNFNLKCLIEIYSILGTRVYSQLINLNGSSDIELDINHLPNGFYTLTANVNGEIFKGIIVKR